MSKLAWLVLWSQVALVSGCGSGQGDWVVNARLATGEQSMFLAGYSDSGGDSGSGGFVKQRQGQGWTTLWRGTPALSAIWAASDERLIAVGLNTILDLNRGVAGFTTVESEQLRGVWGTGPDDVFVVGHGGRIFHGNGNGWSPMASATQSDLHAVWGVSGSDVFAVGKQGTIAHFDGNAWTLMDSGTTSDLNAVWGTASDNLFVVGGSEADPGYVILHYDSVQWTLVGQGDSRKACLLGVHGASAQNVVAVGGFRRDDGSVGSLLLHDVGRGFVEEQSDYEQFLWDVRVLPNEYVVVGPNDTRVIVSR